MYSAISIFAYYASIASLIFPSLQVTEPGSHCKQEEWEWQSWQIPPNNPFFFRIEGERAKKESFCVLYRLFVLYCFLSVTLRTIYAKCALFTFF